MGEAAAGAAGRFHLEAARAGRAAAASGPVRAIAAVAVEGEVMVLVVAGGGAWAAEGGAGEGAASEGWASAGCARARAP